MANLFKVTIFGGFGMKCTIEERLLSIKMTTHQLNNGRLTRNIKHN
jgi:hypothetical protein